MQYPPQGPGPYGYGYAPAPYPAPPPPGPPRKSSNAVVIVIAILGASIVIGGASCLVLIGLGAAVADSLPDASPTASPTVVASSPAVERPASSNESGAVSARAGESPSAVDGRYACFQLRVLAGPNFTFNTTWVPGALPGFTLAGSTYSSSGGNGTISVSSSTVTFTGGGYDGWRGATSTNSTGFFILFRGANHSVVQPGGAKSGDYQCYRQKH